MEYQGVQRLCCCLLFVKARLRVYSISIIINLYYMGKLSCFVGDKYGRLKIVKMFKKPIGNKGREIWYAECECNCGRKTITSVCSLRTGHTQSCGCLFEEKVTSHGKAGSREHRSWCSMMQRVSNNKNDRWNDYGGRGISVCKRWLRFENFYKDMGDRPKNTSLDRIDNSKGYKPSNCRWATRKEQQNNMRSNLVIEYNGEKKTIPEWAEKLGVEKGTLATRIRRGWPVDEAINFPVGKGKRETFKV